MCDELTNQDVNEYLRRNDRSQELIVTTLPKYRAPTHPGEILLEEFLEPLDMTQSSLAELIHVSYPRVNEIINGK